MSGVLISLMLVVSKFTAGWSMIFFFAFCGLVPDFVTLLDEPWNASVDWVDLGVMPEVRRFGGILTDM